MQYWNTARKKYKKGTDQRLEADKKYYEAKADYTDKLKELEDDYKDKCKETNEKLEEDLKEIQEKYDETLADRKKAIKDAFGLFDEFTSESDGPDTLLFNLQSQVKGYQMWVDQLAELESKSILGDDFLTELREMGPDATATIVALNRMTEEQLKQAQKAYAEKNRIAEEQAARETESLKQETTKKLEAAREAAEKEMEKYKDDYTEACKALSIEIDDNLKELATKAYKGGVDAVAGLIKGITDKVATKDTDTELKRLQATFTESISALPETGKSIGESTLSQMLEQFTDSKKIKKGVSKFVDNFQKAFQNLQFEDDDKKVTAADVLKDGEKLKSGATKAAERLGIKNTVKQMQNAIKSTSKLVNSNTSSLMAHASGSNTTAKSKTADSDVLKSTAQVLSEIQKDMKAIQNMGIYLDGDLLAGRLTERIGSELANIAFNTR